MSSRRAVSATLIGLGVVVLAFGVVRLVDSDEDHAPPHDAGALSAAIARSTPAQPPFTGLTEVHLRLGDDRCLRLAVDDTLKERVAGLRDHTDLGPYDGMLFVFPGLTDSAFTMSGVTVPLDIGFFASDGTRTSTLLMKPCAKAERQCPAYRADEPYRYAIETRAGKLPSGSLAACTAG